MRGKLQEIMDQSSTPKKWQIHQQTGEEGRLEHIQIYGNIRNAWCVWNGQSGVRAGGGARKTLRWVAKAKEKVRKRETGKRLSERHACVHMTEASPARLPSKLVRRKHLEVHSLFQ